MSRGEHAPVPQADSSVRPLPRRADRMARPARVRMRRRKPWVLARRRLFGWNVRLLTEELQTRRLRARAPGPEALRGGGTGRRTHADAARRAALIRYGRPNGRSNAGCAHQCQVD